MSNHLVDTYGKEVVKEMLDAIIISKRPISDERMRELLIAGKVITKGTKHILSYYRQYQNGVHLFTAKNGTGQVKLQARIMQDDIPQLIQEVNAE